MKMPIFLPVYHPLKKIVSIEDIKKSGAEGIITNAYFIYSNEKLKEKVLTSGIKKMLGFDGFVMTDSGAFQQLSLNQKVTTNEEIVRFQDKLRADIITIFDEMVFSDESDVQISKKMDINIERYKEAGKIARTKTAFVLSTASSEKMMIKYARIAKELNPKYLAFGNFVPPFTMNHNIAGLIKILKKGIETLEPNYPLHLFGSGHPDEMGFFAYIGINVFDSASYASFSEKGIIFTEKGTRKIDRMNFNKCECDICRNNSIKKMQKDFTLTAKHNLNFCINEIRTIKEKLKENSLKEYLLKKAKINDNLKKAYDEL